MKAILGVLAVLALLAGGMPQASGDTIPVSSQLALRADSEVGGQLDPVGVTATDMKSQSQGGSVNPLSVSVNALANDMNTNEFVATTGVGNATWTSPHAGQVILSNFGWTSLLRGDGGAASLVMERPLNDYAYTFIADASGTFDLSYSITSVGLDTFGLQGFGYRLAGSPQTFGLGTSGTVTEQLVAGQTYTLIIDNGANISGGIGNRDAHMTGTFSFDIPTAQAVPEPASLTLLGLGIVGMMAYGWRRQ